MPDEVCVLSEHETWEYTCSYASGFGGIPPKLHPKKELQKILQSLVPGSDLVAICLYTELH